MLILPPFFFGKYDQIHYQILWIYPLILVNIGMIIVDLLDQGEGETKFTIISLTKWLKLCINFPAIWVKLAAEFILNLKLTALKGGRSTNSKLDLLYKYLFQRILLKLFDVELMFRILTFILRITEKMASNIFHLCTCICTNKCWCWMEDSSEVTFQIVVVVLM